MGKRAAHAGIGGKFRAESARFRILHHVRAGFLFLASAVMMLLNLIITPIYMEVPLEAVKELMLPLLLPFNLVKALLNAAVVLLIYKPVSTALKNIRALDGGAEKLSFSRKTLVLTAAALVVIIGCVLFLVFALNGQFEWVKK